MKSINFLRIMCIYAVVAFLILVITVTFPKKQTTTNNDTQETYTEILTEYVYVKNDVQSDSETLADEKTDDIFIIREYMEKIGIFRTDGTLVDVIETYVKTLPEADIRLLREGFEVVGQRALNSIIEDYS